MYNFNFNESDMLSKSQNENILDDLEIVEDKEDFDYEDFVQQAIASGDVDTLILINELDIEDEEDDSLENQEVVEDDESFSIVEKDGQKWKVLSTAKGKYNAARKYNECITKAKNEVRLVSLKDLEKMNESRKNEAPANSESLFTALMSELNTIYKCEITDEGFLRCTDDGGNFIEIATIKNTDPVEMGMRVTFTDGTQSETVYYVYDNIQAVNDFIQAVFISEVNAFNDMNDVEAEEVQKEEKDDIELEDENQAQEEIDKNVEEVEEESEEEKTESLKRKSLNEDVIPAVYDSLIIRYKDKHDRNDFNEIVKILKDLRKTATFITDSDIREDLEDWRFPEEDVDEIINTIKIDKNESKVTPEKIKKEVEDKIKNIYRNEPEILEYVNVDSYYGDEDGRLVIEVRAELSYDGMVRLAEELDSIVQKYDKYAYFDQVDGGIMNAILDFDEKYESLNESDRKYEFHNEEDTGILTFKFNFDRKDNALICKNEYGYEIEIELEEADEEDLDMESVVPEKYYIEQEIINEMDFYAQSLVENEEVEEDIEITGSEVVDFKYNEETKKGSFEFNIFYETEKDEEINESLNESDNKFDYMMLDRLRTDCEYFLGNGNGYEKHLWAGNVEDQIAEMRKIYDKLPEKPDWISLEDIDRYEKEMLAKRDSKNEVKEITRDEWNKTPKDYKMIKDGKPYLVYLDDETHATVLGPCKIVDESLNEDITKKERPDNYYEFSLDQKPIIQGIWDAYEHGLVTKERTLQRYEEYLSENNIDEADLIWMLGKDKWDHLHNILTGTELDEYDFDESLNKNELLNEDGTVSDMGVAPIMPASYDDIDDIDDELFDITEGFLFPDAEEETDEDKEEEVNSLMGAAIEDINQGQPTASEWIEDAQYVFNSIKDDTVKNRLRNKYSQYLESKKNEASAELNKVIKDLAANDKTDVDKEINKLYKEEPEAKSNVADGSPILGVTSPDNIVPTIDKAIMNKAIFAATSYANNGPQMFAKLQESFKNIDRKTLDDLMNSKDVAGIAKYLYESEMKVNKNEDTFTDPQMNVVNSNSTTVATGNSPETPKLADDIDPAPTEVQDFPKDKSEIENTNANNKEDQLAKDSGTENIPTN